MKSSVAHWSLEMIVLSFSMVEEDGIGHTNAKCYVFGNYNLIYKRNKY